MDLARSLIQRSCQQQVKFMLMAMVMDTVRNVVRVMDTIIVRGLLLQTTILLSAPVVIRR